MCESSAGIEPMTFQNTGQNSPITEIIEGAINQMLNPPHEEGSQP